ncbi:antitermination protein [Sodalis sp. dw_96]|uniref:antitermination protein n=1 Tax=Sodalis sp. dw_96 TaxID=2719794 RepID=UPI001BD23DB9|nr:antitermination protein [Sodalis sp. dw_96]
MKLESLPKFFSPKCLLLGDSSPATATESLSITDVMASLGMVGHRAQPGIELFLSKEGISKPDGALEYLYQYALSQAHRYRAVEKLQDDIKRPTLRLLAVYAYQDYARSAASVRTCECCGGEGFLEDRQFVMNKLAATRETVSMFERGDLPASIEQMPGREMLAKLNYYDITRLVCPTCNGKKVVSNSCRCNGRGEVVDKEKTAEQGGIPVYKTCSKCQGRGYSRIPAETVRRALAGIGLDIPQQTWSRTLKPFYEDLITQCHKEESDAGAALENITR